MERDAFVGMTRHNPRRSSQGAPFVADFDYINKYPAVFTAPSADLIGQTRAAGRFLD